MLMKQRTMLMNQLRSLMAEFGIVVGTGPQHVAKLVAIEGVGVGPLGSAPKPAPERMRNWIGKTRDLEDHPARTYPNLAAAVARMKEANPRLSDEVARHLTLHGTNWESDGALLWKFDN